MHTVLISGGMIEEDFALDFLNQTTWDCLVAVDRGLNFCHKHQLIPNYILGDFDSGNVSLLESYKENEKVIIREFNPEKDFTDTQIGIELACEIGSSQITILGGTGGRMDHFWGNVQAMSIAVNKKISIAMVDSQNHISLLWDTTEIKREEQFGKYVSFFPLGDCVENLTLEGFKYPLTNHRMGHTDGLTVSNEIAEETARITFGKGTVIMMMTRDKA